MKKLKLRYKIILGLFIIILISIAILAVWLLNYYKATDEAVELIKREVSIKVTEENWLVFSSSKKESRTGVIFYPGARVEAKAYAPLAFEIAEEGYQVVIVPMPLNLAVFGINKADVLMETYPEIENWLIAGHSLGGTMASRYANNNAHKLKGLVLLASYPAESDNLSNKELAVLSVYASRDGLISLETIEESRELLPQKTKWVEIDGGNHSQYGYYGFQSGDKEAEISRGQQQQEIVAAVINFLETVL